MRIVATTAAGRRERRFARGRADGTRRPCRGRAVAAWRRRHGDAHRLDAAPRPRRPHRDLRRHRRSACSHAETGRSARSSVPLVSSARRSAGRMVRLGAPAVSGCAARDHAGQVGVKSPLSAYTLSQHARRRVKAGGAGARGDAVTEVAVAAGVLGGVRRDGGAGGARLRRSRPPRATRSYAYARRWAGAAPCTWPAPGASFGARDGYGPDPAVVRDAAQTFEAQDRWSGRGVESAHEARARGAKVVPAVGQPAARCRRRRRAATEGRGDAGAHDPVKAASQARAGGPRESAATLEGTHELQSPGWRRST